MRISFFLSVIGSALAMCLLVAAGVSLYKRNSSNSLHNVATEAVRRGEIVVDEESHIWKIRVKDESYEPVTLELFVRNQSGHQISGYLIFTCDVDTKGVEESYITSVLDKFRQLGFQPEKFNDESVAAWGPKWRALYNYVKRGRELAPGAKFEPLESPPDPSLRPYSFSFRQRVYLPSGEVKRITHNQDIPYKLSGYLLKIKVSGIEF